MSREHISVYTCSYKVLHSKRGLACGSNRLHPRLRKQSSFPSCTGVTHRVLDFLLSPLRSLPTTSQGNSIQARELCKTVHTSMTEFCDRREAQLISDDLRKSYKLSLLSRPWHLVGAIAISNRDIRGVFCAVGSTTLS